MENITHLYYLYRILDNKSWSALILCILQSTGAKRPRGSLTFSKLIGFRDYQYIMFTCVKAEEDITLITNTY